MLSDFQQPRAPIAFDQGERTRETSPMFISKLCCCIDIIVLLSPSLSLFLTTGSPTHTQARAHTHTHTLSTLDALLRRLACTLFNYNILFMSSINRKETFCSFRRRSNTKRSRSSLPSLSLFSPLRCMYVSILTHTHTHTHSLVYQIIGLISLGFAALSPLSLFLDCSCPI